MSAIPSINAALTLAGIGNKTVNIQCNHCKKLLWEVKVNIIAQRVASTETTSYPGVKKYDEVWRKKWNKETKKNEWLLLDPKCPFCTKDFLSAIVAGGHVFPKVLSPEVG